MDIESAISDIQVIGKSMINCGCKCNGITPIKPSKGILPRCLILQSKDRNKEKRGCIVVGINPGSSSKSNISRPNERRFYSEKPSYDQTLLYWEKYLANKEPYYKKIMHLINGLEFQGPILWTELVKCEKGSYEDKFTFHNYPKTFRTCTSLYLQKEIEAIPQDWPIIAIGGDAYNALAFLYSNRVVIGVPHPTGSHGHFSKLFSKDKLMPSIKTQVRNINKNGNVVWLTAR